MAPRLTSNTVAFYNGPLIRRLTKDGLLDASFSGGATGMILEDLRDSNNYIHGVAMQADDKIVVTGWHYRQPPPPQGPTEPQYIAYRLQPAGRTRPQLRRRWLLDDRWRHRVRRDGPTPRVYRPRWSEELSELTAGGVAGRGDSLGR